MIGQCRPQPRKTLVNPYSFAEQFEYDEDDDGSENASTSEEIHEGVTNGAYHRMH